MNNITAIEGQDVTLRWVSCFNVLDAYN